MFPIPWTATLFYLLLYVCTGMALGGLTGLLVSLVFRRKLRSMGIVTDGALGVLGFFMGFIATLFVPWRQNTITENLAGGTVVTTTMHRYQHPERIAVVIAILLPLVRALFRYRRERKATYADPTI
jgi:hypothetical protein